MNQNFSIKGDPCFSPGLRAFCALIIPIIVLVQFFYIEPLWLAIVIGILLLIFAFSFWSASYCYVFDASTKTFAKYKKWPFFSTGTPRPLEISANYIAFQKYDQEYTFHFLNLYETHVPEVKFVLRLVNADGSFITLLETSCFESVPGIIMLGQLLEKCYNVPFKDFVKDLVRRHKI